MERILGVAAQQIYAVLRIVTGFLFMWHGISKLFDVLPTQPGAPAKSLDAMSAIAGGIELVGGILIMIGLFAGFAAFISSGLMAFAYFIAHFSIASGWTMLPIVNKGELAVVYCFLLLYISAVGSGIWSVDSYLNRMKKSKAK